MVVALRSLGRRQQWLGLAVAGAAVVVAIAFLPFLDGFRGAWVVAGPPPLDRHLEMTG